ncbi:MAG TPA: dienelactone hydrolase family protein [Ktedonobacterales bacterium]|nr:dienelactone hydrolase family protein [Ktedonobacterales bacterium]
MCFDVDSQPPVQPLLGSDAQGADITLTSADGAQFAAYAARADSAAASGAGIVILPDVRGLYQFYKDLALRFAEAGVSAVAIDYFARTAGLTPRDDAFEFMPHVQQTRFEQISADVASAVAYLRSQRGADGKAPTSIFTVGFCFGGALSFNQAANKLGLAGVIGFYGRPTRRPATAGLSDTPGPIDLVSQFECPVLGLFGGTDQGIPVEQANQFDQALTAAGVKHEIVIYPGAPHSFFDRKQAEFAKEAADAWNRSLAFIRENTR